MKFVIFFSVLIAIGEKCYAQYSNLEIAIRMKDHDFLNSPVGKLSAVKRGKVKYALLLNDSGKVQEIKLIKSDFGSNIESVCRDEIKAIEFILYPSLRSRATYRLAVEFRFTRKLGITSVLLRY